MRYHAEGYLISVWQSATVVREAYHNNRFQLWRLQVDEYETNCEIWSIFGEDKSMIFPFFGTV